MTKIKAILLDMDGTTRDSRAAIYPAIEGALKDFGLTMPDGGELMRHVHYLRAVQEAFAPEIDYELFKQAYDRHLRERLHTIVVYEHVPEVLASLKRQGYKLAMVSSSRYVRESLEQDGLSGYFDVVVGAYDTKEHKPHPEPLVLAMERLSCVPEETAMVGDLAVDVEAGKAAGVGLTIGVCHGFGSREVLEAAGADHVIDSFAELDVCLH